MKLYELRTICVYGFRVLAMLRRVRNCQFRYYYYFIIRAQIVV